MSKANAKNIIAALPASNDPIFAAIEAHKAAHYAHHVACEVSGNLHGHEPEAEAANAVTSAASDYLDTTIEALADVTPTTLAGVMALLAYIDAYNRGEFPGAEYHIWGEEIYGDDSIKRVNGTRLEMPWAFWIMRNVHRALLDIGTAV